MGAIRQQLDWVQAYSFMLFILLYTACMATVATLQNESRQTSFTALPHGECGTRKSSASRARR